MLANLHLVAGDGVVLSHLPLLLHLLPELSPLVVEAGPHHHHVSICLPDISAAELEEGLQQYYIQGEATILREVLLPLLLHPASPTPGRRRLASEDEDLDEYSRARQLEETHEEGFTFLQPTTSSSPSSWLETFHQDPFSMSSGFASPASASIGFSPPMVRQASYMKDLDLLADDDLANVEFANAVTSTAIKPNYHKEFGTFSNPHLFSSWSASSTSLTSSFSDPLRRDPGPRHTQQEQKKEFGTFSNPRLFTSSSNSTCSDPALSLVELDGEMAETVFECHNRHVLR